MTQTYEAMFVVDNDVVRADWKAAKNSVTGLIEKYGGTIKTARRWDERVLAYPIDGNVRATFLLTYFETDTQSIQPMRRDLELSETILRYLITSAEEIPATEIELSEAELAPGYEAPLPPTEEELAAERAAAEAAANPPAPEREGRDSRGPRGGDKPADGEAKADGEAEAKADGEAKPADGAEAKAEASTETETKASDSSKTEG